VYVALTYGMLSEYLLLCKITGQLKNKRMTPGQNSHPLDRLVLDCMLCTCGMRHYNNGAG